MNQLTFSTEKGSFIVVEVPAGAKDCGIRDEGKTISFSVYNDISREYWSLPPGNWSLIGNLWELTEEQASEICESASNEFYDGYKDYSENQISALHSASASFQSLIKLLNVHKENPYGQKPKRIISFMAPGYETERDREEILEYLEALGRWGKAQLTTFTNAVLLKEI